MSKEAKEAAERLRWEEEEWLNIEKTTESCWTKAFVPNSRVDTAVIPCQLVWNALQALLRTVRSAKVNERKLAASKVVSFLMTRSKSCIYGPPSTHTHVSG